VRSLLTHEREAHGDPDTFLCLVWVIHVIETPGIHRSISVSPLVTPCF
jgi:hypothetical protein